MRLLRPLSVLGPAVLALFAVAPARAIGTPYVVTSSITVGYGSTAPPRVVALGNKVIFAADDGVNGREIWASDGTAGGTVMLADCNPGFASGLNWNDPIVACAGYVFFSATNPVTFNHEVWRTDGTPGGTALFAPGTNVYTMASAGSKLFVEATTDVYSTVCLFVTDGTAPLAGPLNTTLYLSGDNLAGLNGHAYFRGATDVSGYELCTSDGTVGGTQLLKEFAPGSGGSTPQWFTQVGSRLFFHATDGTGFQLGCTDGTGAGSLLLGLKIPGIGFDGAPIVDVNGAAYAIGTDAAHGIELWRSDGTVAGTTLVKDVNPGTANGLAQTGLCALRGRVLFGGDDGVHGPEPWISDGTAGGTQLLKEVRPGSLGSLPTSFAALGGEAFFCADDNTSIAPWISDGTVAGTYRIADIYPGSPYLQYAFTWANNLVFFAGASAATSTAITLWAIGNVTGVPPAAPAPATGLALAVSGANPARGAATIDYVLPAAGPARLRVCDVQGRTVATLVDGELGAGRHRTTLDGSSLAGGVYFCRLSASGRTLERKLVVLH